MNARLNETLNDRFIWVDVKALFLVSMLLLVNYFNDFIEECKRQIGMPKIWGMNMCMWARAVMLVGA